MATVPGVRLLPNAITVLALCAGLSSVFFATQAADHGWPWLTAIAAIGAAAILDSLDGPAARLLRSTSRVGAELDSLSDLVSFGVGPALVTYIWAFQRGSAYGWIFCLLFAVCIALRLARFNSLLDDTPKPYAKGFFTGVPAPAAGLLATLPLALGTRFPQVSWLSSTWFVSLWLVLVALAAVSRLPSIALKSVRVPPSLMIPLLLVLVVAVALAFFQPEIMFALGLGVYLLSIPYSGWKYLYLRNHPELWADRRVRQPRARRTRLSVRIPRTQRVAGRAPDGSPLSVERRRGLSVRNRLNRPDRPNRRRPR